MIFQNFKKFRKFKEFSFDSKLQNTPNNPETFYKGEKILKFQQLQKISENSKFKKYFIWLYSPTIFALATSFQWIKFSKIAFSFHPPIFVFRQSGKLKLQRNIFQQRQSSSQSASQPKNHPNPNNYLASHQVHRVNGKQKYSPLSTPWPNMVKFIMEMSAIKCMQQQ